MYATLPFFAFFWGSLVGAPVAIYTILRRWNAPSSVVPRTRVRFYIAGVLAVAELGVFGFLIWILVRAPSFTAAPK
jgi:hypothetical protein